jgi:hypothetical protein
VQYYIAKDIKEALKMASFLFKKAFPPEISIKQIAKKEQPVSK